MVVQCQKCVQEGVAKLCVEDWDVNSSLLEVGVVMILLYLAIGCGGCWCIIFREKVAVSLAVEELLRKLSGSTTEHQGATPGVRMLAISTETEREAAAEVDLENLYSASSAAGDGTDGAPTLPTTTRGSDIEMQEIEEKEQ